MDYFNCRDQDRLVWLQRAEACANLIFKLFSKHTANLHIADIGCGDQKLKSALNKLYLQLDYQGYDLNPQSPEVVFLDISKESLPFFYEIGVMLGVIEYLENLQDIIINLSQQVNYLVLSHVIQQGNRYSVERLAQLGWRHHFTEMELEQLLNRCSLTIINRAMTPDGKTLIVVCQVNKYKSTGHGR